MSYDVERRPGTPVSLRSGKRYEHRTIMVRGPIREWVDEFWPGPSPGERDPDGLSSALDRLSVDGWEVVSHSMIPANPDTGWGVTVLLRREIL